MQMILPLVYALLFVLLISRLAFFRVPGLPVRSACFLFLLKLCGAIAVYLVYTLHYPSSDFHSFFNDSGIFVERLLGRSQQEMAHWEASFEPVMFNSSKVMILLNAFLRIFSFGNVYVHVVFFCFFSFAGSVALLRAMLVQFPGKRNALIAGIFLVPTVLFWGSSMLKESLIIGTLGFLADTTGFGLKSPRTALRIATAIVLLGFLAVLKLIVALAFVMAIGIVLLKRSSFMQPWWLRATVVMTAIVLLIKITALLSPAHDPLRLMADKRAKAISEAAGGVFLASDQHFVSVPYDEKDDFLLQYPDSSYRIRPGSSYLSWPLDNMQDTTRVENSADSSRYTLLYVVVPATSVIPLEKIDATVFGLLKEIPAAFANVLFRPTLFEISSWLHLFVAVENMWLILLVILAVAFLDILVLERAEVLLFCFVFAAMLFVITGLVTPVMGALIRYRTPAMVFFVPALLLLIDEGKLLRKLKLKV